MALIIANDAKYTLGIVVRNALGRYDPLCDETGKPINFDRWNYNPAELIATQKAVERHEFPSRQEHVAANHTPTDGGPQKPQRGRYAEGGTFTRTEADDARQRAKASRHAGPNQYRSSFYFYPKDPKAWAEEYANIRPEEPWAVDIDAMGMGTEMHKNLDEAVAKFADELRAASAAEEKRRKDPRSKDHPRSPRKGQR